MNTGKFWRQRDKAAAATSEFMNLLYVTPPQHLICMPIPSPEWQNLFRALRRSSSFHPHYIYICSAHVHLPHGRRVKAAGGHGDFRAWWVKIRRVFFRRVQPVTCWQIFRVCLISFSGMFLQIPLEWLVILLRSWISTPTLIRRSGACCVTIRRYALL